MRILLFILSLIVLATVGKCIHVSIRMQGIGSFETEKEDLLQRRAFLLEKVLTTPENLIKEMPSAVGPIFQNEWAMYSCSMLSAALVNMSRLYPETREESVVAIDSLIRIVMSKELRNYDAVRWGEDPLESLDGPNSHISYISILAWMIGGYKTLGGNGKYDSLWDSLCETMSRRFYDSPNFNLLTYPDGYVYVPDELVGIAALSIYARFHDGRYRDTVDYWIKNMKENWTDATGMIASLFPDMECKPGDFLYVLGSYSALICYYMTFVDVDYARELYDVLKTKFVKRSPFAGIREYWYKNSLLDFNIDAGPVIFNLSPSGTAFGIGPATYFEDWEIRNRFLKTAEIAGTTVIRKGKRHYLLADIALVGEAITLAMRTAVHW